MHIWLDTSNVRVVQKATQLGILSGVTTNPTLIAQSQKIMGDVIEDLLHYQEGPITVQVVSEEVDEMIQQGQNLFSFSNRIIVKVPVTKKGLEAIHLLSRQGIPTMATVLFSPRQGLLAALAGANYIAPYISRIEKAGEDPWMVLKTIINLFQQYRFKTKILGASINHVDQIVKCAEIGIYGVTLKEEIFEQFIEDHPLTLQGTQKFNEDWKSIVTPLFVM